MSKVDRLKAKGRLTTEFRKLKNKLNIYFDNINKILIISNLSLILNISFGLFFIMSYILQLTGDSFYVFIGIVMLMFSFISYWIVSEASK